MKRKENKIRTQKKVELDARESSEMRECTFEPTLITAKKNQSLSKSNS